MALDHTTLDITPPTGAAWLSTRVNLFGTPGQERFGFMWELLAQNMDGYPVLVDASRATSISQAAEVVAAFTQIAPGTPHLIAVSRWLDPAGTRTRLASMLGTSPQALVACDPRELADCQSVLHILLDGVHTVAAPGRRRRVRHREQSAEVIVKYHATRVTSALKRDIPDVRRVLIARTFHDDGPERDHDSTAAIIATVLGIAQRAAAATVAGGVLPDHRQGHRRLSRRLRRRRLARAGRRHRADGQPGPAGPAGTAPGR